MKAHDDGRASQYGPVEFRKQRAKELDGAERPAERETCSYCGSITVADVLKAFQTPGVRWSGSDWKYGWPHKFYISIPCEPYTACVGARSGGGRPTEYDYGERRYDEHKFYAEHMVDATPEQIEEWKRVVEPITGVRYEVEGRDLRYFARGRGWQGHGVIGE